MALALVVCVATEMECTLLRPHVPVVVTGVGAVNAAIGLTRFLEREGAERVISCGIGGAYPSLKAPGSGLAIGDAVWAVSECYGDLGAGSADGFLDMEALGFPVLPGLYNTLPLQIFPESGGRRFVTVNTCTGDDAGAKALALRTGGAVESMEGAAIAHVAALYGIPCGEVRGISNPVGNRDRAAWRVRDAAIAAQEALLAFIR